MIEQLEYKRTHTGSLLFDCREKIEITSSTGIGWARKLFDGTPDNLAWTQGGEGEKFIELNLTKVKPTFTKVVVNGYNIEDMKLIFKNGEEQTEPEAEVQSEAFCKTYILKQAVSPEALRLEFTAKRVELYEISLF